MTYTSTCNTEYTCPDDYYDKTSLEYCKTTGGINPKITRTDINAQSAPKLYFPKVSTNTKPASTNKLSLTMARDLYDLIESIKKYRSDDDGLVEIAFNNAELQLIQDLLKTLI